jgi:histone-lysine N-methyltransferase SETMAR
LFLHDNRPAYQAFATLWKLAYLGFQCLDHLPYSPDLAPSGFHLLPALTKQLKGAIFHPQFIAAAGTWWDGQHYELFFSG